jgi:Kef-type K+ transport system membrane component KefB
MEEVQGSTPCDSTIFVKATMTDFLIVGVIFIVCRLISRAAQKLSFPSVLLEIAIGILLLGPLLSPHAGPLAFEMVYWLGIAGLALYMFATGYEMEFDLLRNKEAIPISLGGIILPFALGTVLAIYLFKDPTMVGPQSTLPVFIAFIGSAVSITAFPILARLVRQEKWVDGRLGSTLLSAAAIDDIFAWILLSLCLVLVGKGHSVLVPIAGAVLIPLFFNRLWRPAIASTWSHFNTFGKYVNHIVLLAVAITLSHVAGLHYVFGAFLLGAAWPKNLAKKHENHINDVGLLLVPFFFVYSGMRADTASLFRVDSISLTLLILLVACVGKIVGCGLAAKLQGIPTKECAKIGVMMNCRALMELILINIGLTAGVISGRLFTMLAFMAIVTTYLPKPIMRWLNKD